MRRKRNPSPTGIVEEYNFGRDPEYSYDHLMWVDDRPSSQRCDAYISLRTISKYAYRATAISVQEDGSFTYNQGLVYKHKKRWNLCDYDAWKGTRINGTVTNEKTSPDAASLRRMGMAGYLEMMPRVEAMIERIKELSKR